MTKSQMVLQTDILTKDLVMDKYKAGYEMTSLQLNPSMIL